MLGPKFKFSTVIQHDTDLVSKASIFDLSQHRMDSITHIELKEQVDAIMHCPNKYPCL